LTQRTPTATIGQFAPLGSNARRAGPLARACLEGLLKKPVPFGKYLLLDRINVGGMAEVFLAKPLQDPGAPHLAIKRILPTMVEDSEFLTMFLDEARISVQLNHPNIVQIHELGRHEDSIYIAMDHVSGKDLRQLLDRHRADGHAMAIPQAVFVAAQVCEGLEYAHRKKDAKGADLHIVHRDITPQNILLSYRGEVKIIDFGIAKAANRIQHTQAGILKGKFGYMSPEQVRGMEIDHRSDLFAVGVTLFEMLTGERLFAADSDFSTLERVRTAQVPSPRELNVAIPKELERILLKALAREPADRHPSCGELGKELSEFMRRSGFSYSSDQLGQVLRESFAEDLAREEQRLGQLAGIELEDGDPDRPIRPQPAPIPQQPTPQRSAASTPGNPPERDRSRPPEAQSAQMTEGPEDLPSAHTMILSASPPSLPDAAPLPTGLSALVDQPIAALIEDELRSVDTVIGLGNPRVHAKGPAEKSQPRPPEMANGRKASKGAALASGGNVRAASLGSKSLPLVTASAALAAIAASAAFWALRPRVGQMTVLVEPPGAAITVDGAPVASGEPISLAPGEHVLEAQAGGRKPYRAELELAAGAHLAVEAALDPQAGSKQAASAELPRAVARPTRFDLKVESQPSGALVEIRGRRRGETPMTLRDVDPAEVRQVTVSLKGHRSAQLPVSWDGETREVAVYAALERLERAPASSAPRERPAERRAARAKPAEESGSERPRDATRARGMGWLITNSEPVARVALDGKDSGRWTPISPSQPLDVPAGEHLVTYTDGEGRKAVRSISVTQGETVKVTGVKDFQWLSPSLARP
jgi:serine/threonine protein kinase